MKKLLLSLFSVLITVCIFSQTPQAFKYQAVIRGADGFVLSGQSVSLIAGILQSSETGTEVFSETHNVMTNDFGLINLTIGDGINVTGDISSIDWSIDSYYLKIELDISDGNGYTEMGTAQLLSVPYALFSENTQNIEDADADPANELQTLDVSGTTLSITDGNSVELPSIEDADADPANELQTLDVSGTSLSITNGNTVELPPIDDADADSTNEIQTLDIAGTMLSISDGNSIQIPSAGSQWITTGEDIYYNGGNVGIGSVPGTKLEIHADADSDPNSAIFKVLNSNGDTVFAVYQGGVQINIDEGTKAKKGGFAVGGLASGKQFDLDYLNVSPDSVRIYIRESTTKAKKGGFAVGGLASGKGGVNFLDLTPDNYFIGHEAGANTVVNFIDSTGIYNSFIGYKSGYANIDGSFNIFLGRETGFWNNGGTSNVFIGDWCGKNNKEGEKNVFIGREAGRYNNFGSANIFIGTAAGYSNFLGMNNIFIGDFAGATNEEGQDNIFIGKQSGIDNISGSSNVFLGAWTGNNNTTGTWNTFLGFRSGIWNTIGNSNTFVGVNSGFYNDNGNSNIFIGTNSGYTNTEGSYNIFIGDQAAWQNTAGDYNTILGYFSAFDHTTGNYNCFYGSNSGSYTTTGSYNTFIGEMAGYKNSTGHDNVYLGSSTGKANTTGYGNVCIGAQAGYENVVGIRNVFLGPEAGYSELGSEKLYIENSVATYDAALIYGDFANDDLRLNANVGINGNPADSLALNVYGDAHASGSWYTASDKRWKKNVVNLENNLEKIKNIQGVSYEWKVKEFPEKKFKKGTQLGFIAQDLEEIVPEVVKTDEQGYKSVDYAKLTPLLVGAIKEQQNIIEQQQLEIEEIKRANDRLNNSMMTLRLTMDKLMMENKAGLQRMEPEKHSIPKDN